MKSLYQSNYKRLGGLGPNTGSPDWILKKGKQIKINEYFDKLKQSQKGSFFNESYSN